MSEIVIDSLRVQTFIGVPDAERMDSQEVEIDLCIQPSIGFCAMRDDIACTVDYAAVCEWVSQIAGERPRCLIETLACDIAEGILQEFPAVSVRIEIRKFILPQTRHVAVRWVACKPCA